MAAWALESVNKVNPTTVITKQNWICKYHACKFHAIFQSYRRNSDFELVDKLWHRLELYFKNHELPLCVFMDKQCLHLGENFEFGLENGMAKSRMVLYYLSEKSLDIMLKNLQENKVDYVLWEIEEGLKDIHNIICVPVFVGTYDESKSNLRKFSGINNFNDCDLDHIKSGKCVKETMAKLFRNTGVEVDPHDPDTFVHKIIEILKRQCPELNSIPRMYFINEDKSILNDIIEPKYFLGREPVISDISTHFNNPKTPASVIITGLAGIGKTTIVDYYAALANKSKKYKHILHIFCFSEATLTTSLAKLCTQIGKPFDEQANLANAVFEWLYTNHEYLLIIDNADKVDLIRQFFERKKFVDVNDNINEYFDRRKLTGHVIVTTKNSNIGEWIPVLNTLKKNLPPWDMNTCEEYLRRRIENFDKILGKECEKLALKYILKLFSGHPLNSGVWEAELANGHSQYRAVPTEIPLVFLVKYLEICGFEEVDMNDALKPLEELSLVTSNDNFETMIVHSVVQQAILRNLILVKNGSKVTVTLRHHPNEENDMHLFNALTVQAILAVFPETQNHAYSKVQQELANILLPHVEFVVCRPEPVGPEFADLADRAAEFARFVQKLTIAKILWTSSLTIRRALSDFAGVARVCVDLGNVELLIGDYVSAQHLFDESVNLGDRFPDNLGRALLGLGNVSRNQANYEIAKKYYDESLAKLKPYHHDNSFPKATAIDIANIIRNLGNVALAQGDSAEAKRRFNESKNLYLNVYRTTNHPDIAGVYNSLGIIAKNQGDLPIAKELHIISRDIYKTVYGSEYHLDVACTIDGVGLVLQIEGDFLGAKEHYEESLRIKTQVCCTHIHPEVATTKNNLGNIYKTLGDLVTAKKLFEESLSIYEKFYNSKNHKNFAASLNNLGSIAFINKNLQLAKEYYLKSLEIKKIVFKTEYHPDIAKSLNNLGNIARQQGFFDEAKEKYQESLDIYINVHKTRDHLDVAAALHNLGSISNCQKDFILANSYFKESLKIKEIIYEDKNHLDIAKTMNNLGIVAKMQGDLVSSEKYYLKSLSIKKNIYANAHSDVASTLFNLGLILKEQTKYTRALEYFRECAEMHQAVYGTKDHLNVANTIFNIAIVEEELEDYDNSKGHYKESLEIQKIVYASPNHLALINTLRCLGDLTLKAKQYDEAKGYFDEIIQIQEERNHENVAYSLLQLGTIEFKRNELDTAKSYFLKCIQVQTEVSGDIHENTETAHFALGEIALQKKEFTIAKTCYNQSLHIKYSLYKTKVHLNVAETIEKLADVELCQENWNEAEILLKESLMITTQISPTTCSQVLIQTMEKLQKAFLKQDNFKEEKKILEEIVSKKEIFYKTRIHSEIAESIFKLGIVAEKMKQKKEMQQFFKEAYQIYSKTLGEKHEKTVFAKRKKSKLWAPTSKFWNFFV
ncbi:hypothetical protein HK096_000301 [Nowakowskiella sp. JEL0078]|nr:hypothetical protein HK096_000301 [Nowakowskiella sp. JEL0078]